MRAVVEKLDADEPDDIPALMRAVGMTLISKVGGAGGPLYGTLFLQFGSAAGGDTVTPEGWAACLDAGGRRGAVAAARRSRATRPWWTPSCRRADALRAALAGGRASRRRSTAAADAAEEGARGHHPARRPQGPGELSRRAQRGAPGPGGHLQRAARALRGAAPGR